MASGWCCYARAGGSRGCRAAAGEAEELAGDHEALDLAGAFDDVHGLHVAVELFEQVIAAGPDLAQELEAEARRLERDGGGDGLRHRGLDLVRSGLVGEPGRAPAEQARGPQAPFHALEPITHARVAEQRRLAGEAKGCVERGASDADGHRRDRGPRGVERLHRTAKAVAGAALARAGGRARIGRSAEHVRGRHAARFERERGRFVRLETHLVLDVEAAETGRAPLDHEGALRIAPEGGIERREHDDPVGAARVRRERLRARQHEAVAVAPRARADRGHVAPGSGLRHREGTPARAVGRAERREEALALLRRAEREQRRLAEAGPRKRDGDAAVPVRHLLGKQHGRACAPPRTAGGRGRVGADLAAPARTAEAARDELREEGMLGRERPAGAIGFEAEGPHA